MGAQTAYLASRLMIFLVITAGLLIALTLGVSVSDGDYMPVMLLLMVITGMAWVLISGKNYWILIPLAFNLQIPALPIGARAFEFAELSVLACFCLFCARVAFKVQDFTLMKSEYLWVGVFVAWVAFVYQRNPTGLLVFGASSGGARFYFKLILAFMSFLVLSNQRFGAKECKWIVWMMLVGSLATAIINARNIASASVDSGNFGTVEENTWQQVFINALMIGMAFLLGRFRLDQIFSLNRIYLPPLFFFILFATLMTGKRAVFAIVVTMPVIMAVLRRQWQFVAFGAIGMVVALAFIVLGQGRLFDLPYNMQRSLMYLPGDWDPKLRGVRGEKGSLDSFREMMNERAIAKIKESPWIGPGFQVNVEEFSRIMATQGSVINVETQIEMLAKGSAWHNQWLGMAADYGIPAAVIWFFYYIQVFVVCLWLWPRIPFGNYRHILLVMVGMFFYSQIMTSWTGGHSALTPWAHWWQFGILISLRHSVRREEMDRARLEGTSREQLDPDRGG